MIVYPLDSPTQFGVAAVNWGVRTNSARARSPWSLEDYVQVFDGAMWRGSLSIMPQTTVEARSLTAWLVALQGRRGTFLLGDPAAENPLGSSRLAPGSPVVNGSGQVGQDLLVSGMPANTVNYLRAGDYLQIGVGLAARLHMTLTDVNSDAAGQSTISIWPSIRLPTTNGTPITVISPQGIFSLASGEQSWNVRRPVIYDEINLDVEEVVSTI
jgi:hypothetical protein